MQKHHCNNKYYRNSQGQVTFSFAKLVAETFLELGARNIHECVEPITMIHGSAKNQKKKYNLSRIQEPNSESSSVQPKQIKKVVENSA